MNTIENIEKEIAFNVDLIKKHNTVNAQKLTITEIDFKIKNKHNKIVLENYLKFI